MRLVYRASRDVKLRLPVHSSPSSPGCVRRATSPGSTLAVGRVLSAPALFRTACSSATELESVFGSPYSNAVAIPPEPAPAPRAPKRNDAGKPLLQEDYHFGRWRWLLNDPQRLALETDFAGVGPAKRRVKHFLIDRLESQNDFELWGCLLDYLRRRRGDDGIAELWKALWGRKKLYATGTPTADHFWRTMAEAAVRSGSDKFMENIWLYAEWMANVHQTIYPGLYITIVPYFLRTHQHNKAVSWHLRLSQRYLPSDSEFVNILKHFSTDADLLPTLHTLYKMSHQRRMYDVLVPYLYGRGHARLARAWRKTCLALGDQPTLHAPARPFVRYIAGYWQSKVGNEAELAALVHHGTPEQEAEPSAQQLEISREFVNRVQGKTFGLSPKSYNDRLGSRWFASSWISLDMAISVVLTLGIQEIGPLSLQSIALREQTPKAVAKRLHYLEAHGIRLPKTNYVRLLRYFAKTNEADLLSTLLTCDIHPDVFDDLSVQADLMQSSSASEDWTTYTLLLAAKVALFEYWSETAANALLTALLAREKYQAVLNTLDDMRIMRVPLDAEAAHQLIEFIQIEAPLHHQPDRPPGVPDSCLGLFRRLLAMDVPLPVSLWRRMIYSQARSGNLADAHQLILDALEFFTEDRHLRRGHVPVHVADLPPPMAQPLGDVANLIGVYIPLDTPFHLPAHPMAKIFDGPLLSSLIRWSYRAIAEKPKPRALLQLPGLPDLDFVQALRIIRKLKDAGLNVPVPAVQKSIVLRLAELYGRATPTKASHTAARQMNMIPLTRMRDICNQAWGGPILPENMDELRQAIEKRDVKREQIRRDFDELVAARKRFRGPDRAGYYY